MTENQKKNPLGEEKIHKLLANFAIPSIVAMLISSLYNIVDQIFIGQYVGDIGNAATNVAFPITTICIAISVLAGVGGASHFSIELGRGHKDEASKCLGNALWLAGSLGVIYTVIAFFFTEEMLTLFGGSGNSLRYALWYTDALIYGMPFLILTNVMSNFIRADGTPRFSMVCMIIGAVINIGLDALFVSDWGFDWGMAGAAGATVVSQIISCVIAFTYITRFKSVHISVKSFAFNIRKIIKIASLGMSNCINQVAICGVQIVMNNQLDTYGVLEFSKELAHIPQAAFGVVMKVNSLLISFFVGMAQGSQPIVGFNYGARKLYRSKKTFLMAAGTCFAVALVGFTVFQTVPQAVISIFGSGIKEYNDFAEKTMRIFLSMIMLNGVQMTIANYFSAIGKPIKGAILSLTRQVLLIIPLMIILPKYMGLDGVLYSAPITDLITFLLALGFIFWEFRNPEYKKMKNEK